ncbi:class I SAM-dependent methyltransferase [Actinokineospora inagensis]|uniref:class I SAM-dependent methyltransferase n=1 Tax=Actinokineospora inagensis TaxID=103730 RepID=UPI00042823B9|nr:class I SAM-dependent methyltransferase [Actinokineospora inagensis]
MPDPVPTDVRLARVYEAFDGPRDDLAAYLAITDELDAHTVVDVGCGTGTLATLLAATGRAVTGVDPDEPALAIARTRSATVTWLPGDATTLPPLDADLAIMTGNVAQVFLADDDWFATLRAVHAVLRPGGHLVFETRRPERRAWLEWDGDRTLDVPGIGPVHLRRVVTAADLPFVTFRDTYRMPGAEVVRESTLRFRSQDEIESSLVATGYRVRDLRDAPDRPGREYVFIAERIDNAVNNPRPPHNRNTPK